MADVVHSATLSLNAKTCSICNELKDISDFERHPTSRHFRGQCRPCRRARNREYNKTETVKQSKRKYGRSRRYCLTNDRFEKLLADQNGCCAVCKRENSEQDFDQRLQVDHCHKTGRIRGLLCGRCNRRFGQFGDDVEEMRRHVDLYVEYLARPETGLFKTYE